MEQSVLSKFRRKLRIRTLDGSRSGKESTAKAFIVVISEKPSIASFASINSGPLSSRGVYPYATLMTIALVNLEKNQISVKGESRGDEPNLFVCSSHSVGRSRVLFKKARVSTSMISPNSSTLLREPMNCASKRRNSGQGCEEGHSAGNLSHPTS